MNLFKYFRINLRIILTAIAIVMVWRGVWGLLDLLLFPNSEWLSYTVSFLLGVTLLILDDKKLLELFPLDMEYLEKMINKDGSKNNVSKKDGNFNKEE